MQGLRRLGFWLISAWLLASLPYLFLMIFMQAPNLPTFERMTGLGQLLLTSLALLGSGIRELHNEDAQHRAQGKRIVNYLSLAFAAASFGVWCLIQADFAVRQGDVPFDVQHTNAWRSVILFGMSALVAANAVLLATPPPKGPATGEPAPAGGGPI